MQQLWVLYNNSFIEITPLHNFDERIYTWLILRLESP